MKITIKVSISVLAIAIIMLFSSCVQEHKYQNKYNITSSLENLSKDKKNFLSDTDSSYSFKGGEYQSNIQHRSGNYSVVSTPKNAYTLSLELPGIKMDSYVEASVWRKGGSGNLVAITSGSKGYISTKDTVEVDRNGWIKLLLKFYVPPVEEFQKLKFYVWNSKSDTTFFDDISIQITDKYKFPEFKEEAFHIEMDTSELL